MVVTSSARLRYVSIPPRKMRLVADMVKGLPVQKALDILNFTPKIAARHLAKTVKSAAANALSVEGTDVVKAEDLLVKNITVDAAPTAKRIRFQSMGRVYRYRKRFCHLTVMLQGETEEASAAPVRKAKKRKPETAKSAKTSSKADKVEKPAAKTKRTAKKPSGKADKTETTEAKPKKSAAKKATGDAKEEKKDDGE